MTQELSPRSSNEDWTQWEIVDVKAQSQKFNSPLTSALKSPEQLNDDSKVPINQNVQSNEENDKDGSFGDLQEQYRQQQQRLQEEQMKCRQLTREVEKSILINQTNMMQYQNNGHAKTLQNQENDLMNSKQTEYERIVAENQTNLKQLERQKEQSQRMVGELIQTNEEMKKKIR